MSIRWWILGALCLVAGTGCNDDSPGADGSSGGDAGVGATGGAGTDDASGAEAGATGGGAEAGAAAGGEAGAASENPNDDGSANVVAVAVTGDPNAYGFDVTLETTDVDCSHFADWWEVVTPEGELVYRRILAHPHTDGLSGNPFTRGGGPVEIAADQEVVVRAHLNDLGYVGVARRGTAGGSFVIADDIDATFATSVESETPQPDECIPEEQIVGG